MSVIGRVPSVWLSYLARTVGRNAAPVQTGNIGG